MTLISFPGSAWERTLREALPQRHRIAATLLSTVSPRGGASGIARSQAEPGNEVNGIVQKAVSEWLPLSQGVVQFNFGSGIEELIAAWLDVAKAAQIRSVT